MAVSRKPVYEADLYSVIAAMQERIQSLERRETVPLGGILPFAGVNVPPGFLLCNGDEYARTRNIDGVGYPELFTTIGTTYGSGDGSLTFNVPNIKGRFLLGEDLTPDNLSIAVSLGDVGGEESHLLVVNELPAHTHTGTVTTAGGATTGPTNAVPPHNSTPAAGQPWESDPEGSDDSHNNMPPYIVVKYIIAAL